MKKRFIIGILIILILSQLVQPRHNDGNAESIIDINHFLDVPDTIRSILKTSCYDCHSNHTIYPWYSKITPVNWWLNNHIENGKSALNFTTFRSYTFRKMAHRMDDIAETVQKNEMPLNSYLWIHAKSKLSQGQQKILIAWSKNAKAEILKDSLSKIR